MNVFIIPQTVSPTLKLSNIFLTPYDRNPQEEPERWNKGGNSWRNESRKWLSKGFECEVEDEKGSME
jgi:hypothetical protein